MKRDYKFALIWGTSTKHMGMAQHCGLSHGLHDEDVVQIVTKTAAEQKQVGGGRDLITEDAGERWE